MELSEQFQYGSAFKNKPNSQGTLFRPARKGAGRTPESRQPKGYSPERFKEVGRALGISKFQNAETEGASHHIQQSIARSTVPVEHIGDIPGVIPNSPELQKWQGAAYEAYEDKTPGPIHVGTGHSKDASAVIHEIGHHVTRYDVNLFSENPHDQGKSEGIADAYADTHARKPGYKRKRLRDQGYGNETRGYEWGEGFGYKTGSYERRDLNDAYNAGRYGNHRVLHDLQFRPTSSKSVNQANREIVARNKGQQELKWWAR